MIKLFIFFFLSLEAFAGIKVYKVTGNVSYYSSDGKRIEISTGSYLSTGMTIKTSSASEVELVYDDGIMILLSENSSLTIGLQKSTSSSISFLNIFDLATDVWADDGFSDNGWLDYLYGKAMFFVNKLENMQYKIKTPIAVFGVRGTNFSIISDNNSSEIGVFKGEIEVMKGDERVVLKAGQSAIVDKIKIRLQNRFSSIMEKERKRAHRLERYFENVMRKLKERDERTVEKINRLRNRLKQ